MTTHNKSGTAEYQAWNRIKNICYNPNVPGYKKYGGKGIRVCDEWVNDSGKFLEDMGKMSEKCNGIELIDETKDFCKINCRWTRRTQGAPAKKNKRVKTDGREKIKNSVAVCISLDAELLDFIRTQSAHETVRSKLFVSANDMIRDALKRAFPVPTQYDMFGDLK